MKYFTKRISIILSIAFLTLASFNSYSDELPDPLDPPRIVNSYVKFLSNSEEQNLEQKLRRFNNSESTQISIAIVDNLQGYDKSSYAFRLAEKWGIGQEGKDNGILILVKTKTNNSKGEVFIATGYGLESVIPDAIAKRIVEKEIIPNFRKGLYFNGLNEATNTLISLSTGKFTADDYIKATGSSKAPFPISIVFIFIIIFSIFGRVRGARRHSVGHNIPFWVALTMMGSSGRHSGGGFNNFSSGSGSFGGGSSFGGFGGGSFGGGGAGGSW
ncbi:MAG: TPM domain-containing protein [Bacteroidota bacterium]|nr:TPM domain-containing protein [Bacteroidota bacterium]